MFKRWNFKRLAFFPLMSKATRIPMCLQKHSMGISFFFFKRKLFSCVNSWECEVRHISILTKRNTIKLSPLWPLKTLLPIALDVIKKIVVVQLLRGQRMTRRGGNNALTVQTFFTSGEKRKTSISLSLSQGMTE